MPPNLQRYLPVLLVVLLLLFVVPSLLKKKSHGPTAKTQAAQTIDAVNLIDQGEESYLSMHSRYTSHLADLVAVHPSLAADLASGLVVTLDASADGQSYVQLAHGAYLSFVRARNGAKLVASKCVVVKSASGVACPA